MPANWRPASIPLVGGLVTSVPAKSLEPGQFAQLDNAVFDGSGAPEKRHGSDGVDCSWGLTSGMPTDPEWVMGYGWAPSTHLITGPSNNQSGAVRGLLTRDGDLLAYDGTRMMQRTPAATTPWTTLPTGTTAANYFTGPSLPGTVHIPHLETRQITSQDTQAFDAVRGDHVEVMLFNSTVGATGTTVVVRDNTTGAVIGQNNITASPSFGSQLRLGVAYIPPATGAVYGTFVAFQNDAGIGDLYISWASEATPTTWTNITVTTTAATDGVSIRADANYAYVAQVDGGGLIWIERVDRFGTRTSFNVAGAGGAGTSYVDLSIHPDGRLMLAWVVAAATDDVYTAFYASDLATPIVAPYAVYTGSKTVIGEVTCEWSLLSEQTGGGDPEGIIFFPGGPGGDLDYCLVQGGTASLAPNPLPRMDLGSRAFRVGNTVAVVVQYYSALSNLTGQYAVLYFDHEAVLNFGALTPCGSWFRGTVTAAHRPFSVRVDGLRAHMSGIARRPYDPAAALHGVTLDFGAPLRSVQAGRATYVAGALVWEYDGTTIHEAGFLDTPKPTLTPSSAGGLMTSSAVYTYRIYMMQKNAQGEVTRSAGIIQTVSMGASDDRVDIAFPAMPLCTRPFTWWEVYRSQANGAVLTRTLITDGIGTEAFYPVSRTTAFAGVYDQEADGTIATQPIDPIPFGVVDNVAPPACSMIAQGKDRVWYAGGDLLPGQVAYSKFWDPGETPAWNEALLVESDRSGPVTGVGFIGDWLIVFSPTNIYQYAGDGPSNLGLGDFTPPRLVSSDTGCLTPDSVVLTPLGVAFQSRKGIRVMGPGGALMAGQSGLLGSVVDPSFYGEAVGSCLVAEQDHARWALPDGTVMIWDYSVDRWARWTGYRLSPYGTPAVLKKWAGGMVVAEEDRVLIEDTSAGTDGSRTFRFVASLGWLSPHGPLNWGRVRRWSLEGDALGGFTAQVFVDYDFKDGPLRQTYTWAASTSRTGADGTTYDHDPGSWGSDSAWGQSPSWGGDTADGGAFPVNVRFNRQKCTSFRFTITDTGEPNRTLALRRFSIEFAPQAGLVRAGGRNI